MSSPLLWKVSTVDLIKEISQSSNEAWALRIPLTIFKGLLAELAEYSAELDDPKLNIFMLRLGLYDVHPLEVDKHIQEQVERNPDNG